MFGEGLKAVITRNTEAIERHCFQLMELIDVIKELKAVMEKEKSGKLTKGS